MSYFFELWFRPYRQIWGDLLTQQVFAFGFRLQINIYDFYRQNICSVLQKLYHSFPALIWTYSEKISNIMLIYMHTSMNFSVKDINTAYLNQQVYWDFQSLLTNMLIQPTIYWFSLNFPSNMFIPTTRLSKLWSTITKMI